MESDRLSRIMLRGLAILVILGMAGPVLASPAPVSGCPPCDRGFIHGASTHGLETEVQYGEATVRVHTNGSATWRVRVVPTNDTVMDRLATNQSLARAVAADSFGTRYGNGIPHELLSTAVTNGAFVMRYRTLDVVQEGPLGTQVLTYFRDSPGAYVYTDLGADELTVVAPPGMTVAHGFGEVSSDRMTATELPDVRDGPFVVFASQESPTPGLLGILGVASALWGVVVRNLLYFVALPAGILIGGFSGIRRFVDADTRRNPTRLGSITAASGAVVLVVSLLWEGDPLPVVTDNLLLGSGVGLVLLALGASIAASRVRQHLTGVRIVGGAIAFGIVAALVTDGFMGTGDVHGALMLATALLPAAVGLGWADVEEVAESRSHSLPLFSGLSVVIIGGLIVSAPLTALGGTMFLLVPLLLTVVAVGIVVIAIPLYVLGAVGANAERT